MSLLNSPYDRNETYVDTSPVLSGTMNDVQDALKILQLNERGSKPYLFGAPCFVPVALAGPLKNSFEYFPADFGIAGITLSAGVPIPAGMVITSATWLHNHGAVTASAAGHGKVRRVTFPVGGSSDVSTTVIPAAAAGGFYNQYNEYVSTTFSYTVPAKTAIILEYKSPSLNDTIAAFGGCLLSFGWPP